MVAKTCFINAQQASSNQGGERPQDTVNPAHWPSNSVTGYVEVKYG